MPPDNHETGLTLRGPTSAYRSFVQWASEVLHAAATPWKTTAALDARAPPSPPPLPSPRLQGGLC